MKRAHYCKRMLHRKDCIKNVDVLHDRVFLKTTWQIFWCSAGIKDQDFVQPLVVFPNSNISYWGLVWTDHNTQCHFGLLNVTLLECDNEPTSQQL